MPVFFNGRLWVSPVTVSVIDDSRMYNKNLSVDNVLALIGRSEGGKPATALRFGSPQEARALLRKGELLDAVEKAFDPSSQTGGPVEVVAFRVNPATQAALVLKDSGTADSVDLVSTDYGLYTNEIKVKIEAGSVKGKKLTTQFGNAYYTKDNVARDVMDVVYTGAEATATITTNGTQVVLSAPAGTPVSTIDLTVYPTVLQLVDKINTVAGFTATVKDGNNEAASLQGLDFVTAQSVKTTAYTVTANLQACVDWFNSTGEGFVTATRRANVGAQLANIAFTYLAGGNDGTVTNTEWQNCFDALQAEDVQWVVPVSNSPSIHAMADTHVTFMSNVARMERRCIVGGPSGATDDAALAAAKTFNNDRSSYTHLGYYDYDHDGDLVLFPPYMTAALLGGMFAGVNPGTALTNKTIKVRGLERKLRNPVDTDRLIEGGVLCIEDTKKGYKVVQSISTWLANRNYNRVEVSTGVATDFVARNVRNALDDLRGARGNPATLQLAVEMCESALRELARPEPAGPGVIVGDAASPAYRNIVASIEGDVLRVEFECSPVIPINYVLVVIHAVPWSGTIRQK